MNNEIVVVSRHRAYTHYEDDARRCVTTSLSVTHTSGVHIELFFVTPKIIQHLNLVYRNKNTPTNVLSFCEPTNFIISGQSKKHIGEIYICPSFIQKKKQSLEHMVVHGTLHLLGYDHIHKHDQCEMEDLETKILKKIGLDIVR